jgi:hypothetical protein
MHRNEKSLLCYKTDADEAEERRTNSDHFGRSQEAVTETLYRKPIFKSKALKHKERSWDTRFTRRTEGGSMNANKLVSSHSFVYHSAHGP